MVAAYLEQVKEFAESERGNGFTWVYRAEGDLDPEHIAGDENLVGTWFTPSFEFALGQVQKLTGKRVPNPHLVAMVIPKSLLNERDQIQKGMNEINLMFRDRVKVRDVSEPILEEPNADAYVNQFRKEEVDDE